MPFWEWILYFHFLPAVLDGFVALVGVLLLLRIFRVRDHSVRILFLFIPLVRPLIVFLEGGVRSQQASFPNLHAAVRIVPDPFRIIPFDRAGEAAFSTFSELISILIIVTLIAALISLMLRWFGFLFFYRRLRRQTSEKVDDKLSALVEKLSQDMGLRRSPEILLLTGNWATPCAIGWRRPFLLVEPSFLNEFSDHEQRAFFAHEIGHLRRRDGLWHWISVLLRDLQSFSPASHLSIARLRLEQEKACDQAAIEDAEVPPRLLAECLVKASRLMSSRKSAPPGFGLAFFKGNRRLMERRVKYLLAMPEGKSRPSGRKEKTVGRKAKIAGLLIAWLPLTLMQFSMFTWIGPFPLVIK